MDNSDSKQVESAAQAQSGWFDVESASLLSVGRVKAGAYWTIAAHSHDFWEFLYFRKGSGRIDMPDQTINPRQYHLVIYPPGLIHAESSNPADPEETSFLTIRMRGSADPGMRVLLPDSDGDIGWLVERIMRECEPQGPITALARAYTRALLYLVARAWQDGIHVKDDIVDLAVQFIRENHARQFDLDELAEAVHTSKTHLVHKFTARIGVSPMRYLQQVRVENGKRLLATTSMPVNKIAAQIGFPDALYFSRVFKNTIGVSPTLYRQPGKFADQSMPTAT